MENLFDIKLVKSTDNLNHIDGCHFYTSEGLPYQKTTFFKIEIQEGVNEPIFFINKEQFNLPELLQKEDCRIFWAKQALVFRFGDLFYSSPQLPEIFFKQIIKNGKFKLKFPIDDKNSDDYEIQEESLCQ